MIKKRQRKIGLALMILVLSGSAVITTRAITQERIAQEKLSRDYIQGMELIRENYVEPMEYELLTTTAIQGMLRSLDPHSSFYDRKTFDEFRMEQRSQYYGIGASIQQRHRGVYIIEPFKDTPAGRAGLRYGDQIIAINGQNSENWNSDKVRDNLRGELGTEARVTVRRPGVDIPVSVTMERAAVDLPSVSGFYMLKPGVGYIALSRGFHSTTSDEIFAAINELKAGGMQSLVFDLRGNPGGYLDQAIRVADKFLQRGQTIVSVKSRESRLGDKDWAAESGMPETFPMVVLIDDGSASASEIVAGAIQDHDRGLIVGESSFGKGLVQSIFPLNGGAGLTLTTARYFTPSGRLIQRDYSNGSRYQYQFQRYSLNGQTEAKKPRDDQRRTDTGRIVYGGGGIDPDVKIESPTTTNVQNTIWSTGLFMFVTQLVAGKIPVAPRFKLNGTEFDHLPQPGEFLITDDLMKSYRDFMSDFIEKNRDFGLTMAMIDENMAFARSKIRDEVLIAAYGVDKQKQMTVENDVQLQRAIQEIPQSAQLAERARKLSRTSKK